ncbi:putative nucleic acid-binding protein [Friedmanniella endophytica]|uniref:Putative nucleic acid-binding protein n=1 Tax=Microlunatus kandeliicorticis TaxID=1759536 RepID=A0A7W3P709_9ACTN|nr:hypothetical protein [Microlunatus kandeliicorticis]MBA8795495.1 putative nucleic acid-binding protein [Microlunatus kandeliicorticis]
MTRYAIDAAVALDLVRRASDADRRHPLVGPAVLRSQVLARVWADVRSGRLDEPAGRALVDRLAGFRIRLLGDRVSRATAWRIAREADWDDVTAAEYLAVAVLQADVLVTDDPELRARADGRIAVAGPDVLDAPPAG